jgi:hypothetical protein
MPDFHFSHSLPSLGISPLRDLTRVTLHVFLTAKLASGLETPSHTLTPDNRPPEIWPRQLSRKTPRQEIEGNLPQLLATLSMASLRRSSRIRLKNDKLASANTTATSTSASTSTNKDHVLVSAAVTSTPTTPSDPVPVNDKQVLATITPFDSTLESDTKAPTSSKRANRTHTLEDDALASTTALTNATAITTVIPATTITSPLTTSDLSPSLSRLARELRDYVHIDLSLTEATWIGTPPNTTGKRNVVIEKPTMRQPATFVRTNSSIVLASSEVRDEFRTAVWRSLMESDREVDLRLYDFDPTPLRRFFDSCSPSELEKLRVKGKCHMHIHLTEAFQPVPRIPIMNLMPLIQDAIVAWVQFCRGRRLQAEQYSFDDGADFYDLRVAEAGVQHEIADQSAGFRNSDFFRTFDHISAAAKESMSRRGPFG